MSRSLQQWFSVNWANVAVTAGVLAVAGAAMLSHADIPARANACRPPAVSPVVGAPGAGSGITMVAADSGIHVSVGRGYGRQTRTSGVLALPPSSTLAPGTVLAARVTDLVRGDDAVLEPAHARAWGEVVGSGTGVLLHVCLDPRAGEVGDPGRYTGAVFLDDRRVHGGVVPVTADLRYPYLDLAVLWALVAAVAGLMWAWMMRRADASAAVDAGESRVTVLLVRAAALLAAAPVALRLVVGDPQWRGDLVQYAALMTTCGATVIAAVPTLRALASRTSEDQQRRDGERAIAPAPAVS